VQGFGGAQPNMLLFGFLRNLAESCLLSGEQELVDGQFFGGPTDNILAVGPTVPENRNGCDDGKYMRCRRSGPHARSE